MHCIYVDASPEIPGQPAGPNNARRCVARDFGPLRLTKQQPTVWRVSTGRLVDPTGPIGACQDLILPGVPPDPDVMKQNCPGFDPGAVPNVTSGISGTPEFVGFEGELKCVQIDDSGSPVGGNALKGEAIIESLAGGGLISSYNALGITANAVNSDGVLNLDNAEYNACPDRLVLNHFAQGADDPALLALGVSPGVAPVETELTIVPCTEDFFNGVPESVNVQVLVTDELESRISAPLSFDCWTNQSLDYNPGAFLFGNRHNSTVLKTELRSTSASGILAIAEDYRVINGTRTGSSAVNLDAIGLRSTPDRIVLHSATPEGTCVGGPNDTLACFGQSDCDGGTCTP
jgi:hypothetical protein